MRLRALMLICSTMALLSGLALFSSLHARHATWLNAIFLVSVLVALIVSLSLMMHAAADSFRRGIKEDNDDQPDAR